jgi:hypothetical protein
VRKETAIYKHVPRTPPLSKMNYNHYTPHRNIIKELIMCSGNFYKYYVGIKVTPDPIMHIVWLW